MVRTTARQSVGTGAGQGSRPIESGEGGDRLFPRACGILLHPTSLPGPHGIGDLGAEAFRFVDFLRSSRQSLWQLLPLQPVSAGNSPYSAPSAFAGNPLLISLETLCEEGLLSSQDLATMPSMPTAFVDYDRVRDFKIPPLRRAFEAFRARPYHPLRRHFTAFCEQETDWLDDFALFMALREKQGESAWTTWGAGAARRDPDVLEDCRRSLAESIDFHRFLQFVFAKQWAELRRYANNHGVRLLGDLPIFVAHDSADVWTHRELFQLDANGQPSAVAGVPPDYYSDTGQRWGNPLYRWDRLAEANYSWWIARFRRTLDLVDAVRIDHFRGFAAYWEVPASHTTARYGRWVPGPGAAVFEAMGEALGTVPIIVEDLGLITPDVEQLRDTLGYPGMKVLQFAFDGDPANPYLPHNYERNCVVYTATHDNDTSVGWFSALSPKERGIVKRYLGTSAKDFGWELMRLAYSSVADTAVVPMQDFLRLGTDARMNFPGHTMGNWSWRFSKEQVNDEDVEHLALLSTTYRRDGTERPKSVHSYD